MLSPLQRIEKSFYFNQNDKLVTYGMIQLIRLKFYKHKQHERERAIVQPLYLLITETPHNLLQKSTPVYTDPAFEEHNAVKLK